MGLKRTINPYSDIGTELSTFLNNLSGPPANVGALVTDIVNYVSSTYYAPGATTQQKTELSSIAYNAINAYTTNLVLNGGMKYNANQMAFINLLIRPGMTANTAPASVVDAIADIEDNIGTSFLTMEEQRRLFLATTLGAATFAFWGVVIAPGYAGPWVLIPTPSTGQNYMNSLLWNVAAMNGALAAYGASTPGLVEPTTAMEGNTMISALIGAAVATVGKFAFNWAPRIMKPLTLNLSKVSGLKNNPTVAGGAQMTISLWPCTLNTCWCPQSAKCPTNDNSPDCDDDCC